MIKTQLRSTVRKHSVYPTCSSWCTGRPRAPTSYCHTHSRLGPQFLFRLFFSLQKDRVQGQKCKMHPKHELFILTVNSDGRRHVCKSLRRGSGPWLWTLVWKQGTESGAGPFSASLSPVFTLCRLARSCWLGTNVDCLCFAHEVTLCVYFGSVLIPGSQHCLGHWGKVNRAYICRLHRPSSVRASWSIINL